MKKFFLRDSLTLILHESLSIPTSNSNKNSNKNNNSLKTATTIVKNILNRAGRYILPTRVFVSSSSSSSSVKIFETKNQKKLEHQINMPAITCASSALHLSGSPASSPTTPTATTVVSDSSVTAVSTGMAALSITPRVRTLIVDDNVITARMLSKILSREFGHITTCTVSGKEALERLSFELFDIIFMDIDMPELSGIETTLAIHAAGSTVLEENRKIPIIAYTTNPCEERYFEAGMNGWVSKPASQSMVRKELERVCSSPVRANRN